MVSITCIVLVTGLLNSKYNLAVACDVRTIAYTLDKTCRNVQCILTGSCDSIEQVDSKHLTVNLVCSTVALRANINLSHTHNVELTCDFVAVLNGDNIENLNSLVRSYTYNCQRLNGSSYADDEVALATTDRSDIRTTHRIEVIPVNLHTHTIVACCKVSGKYELRQTLTLVEVLIIVSIEVGGLSVRCVTPAVGRISIIIGSVVVVCNKLATCCTVSVNILSECVVVVVVDVAVSMHPLT